MDVKPATYVFWAFTYLLLFQFSDICSNTNENGCYLFSVSPCQVLCFVRSSPDMPSLTAVLDYIFYFTKDLNVPNACNTKWRRQKQQQTISWKSQSPFALSGPCAQFPTTSPSSLPPKPPPLHPFPLWRKTGEREDDVWQMPYFDFLSGRLILTQCVSYQGLVDCVCWALISLSSAQPLFS